MEFGVVVTDLAGANKAFLEPDSLEWTRRWCGGSEIAFRVPTTDDKAGELLIAKRAIKVYQDGVLRFRGRVQTPLRRAHDWITVRGADPWFDLASLHLTNPLLTSYTATDAGAIAWSAISNSGARVSSGTIAASVNRTLEIDLGTSIDAIVSRLSAMSNGFGFRFDPVETAGIFAAFNVFYPAQATDRPELRLEYGDGTLANLDGFLEEIGLPTNSARVAGAPATDGTKPQALQEDASSIATYDRFSVEISASEEGADATLLGARAGGALVPDPPSTYQVTPSADSPILGRDFDVGDVARIMLRHGVVNVQGSALITEAKLVASNESGGARLASLTLAAPAIARFTYPPQDRLFELLGSLSRRIGGVERTPFAGA